MLNSAQSIRSQFIAFFENKKHLFVQGAPVVPQEDPTLLFTNAGMNQFKDIFLGHNPKNWTRAVNSQPCIRVSGKHNDLEDVGYDGTHQTLFEMLGNWSFGDYYKKEAIVWAWEFLREEMKIPKSKLYVTVYEDDDEAFDLWITQTDIAESHVFRFGKKDNFWEMGQVGPCGPCSEIHVDLDGEDDVETAAHPVLGVNGENARFVEFWNLVFIQFERLENGDLKDLVNKHIDTGMGLERLCSYMQGVRSNYETDLFTPIIDAVAARSGIPYSAGESGVPHRVITDHIRALTFSIADNVMPSNEGRGYVMRRLLRRALRYAHKLNIDDAFMYTLVPILVDIMQDAFPHLLKRADFVAQVVRAEEESFLNTLESGIERFKEIEKQVKDDKKSTISGERVFKLYDTFGFPADLTALMAKEAGLEIDLAGFDIALDKQKERSRKAQKQTTYVVQDEGSIDFAALARQMPDLYHSPHQTVARGGEARILSSHEDKRNMARHHTATHLLHEALREVLGDHVQQAGSLVDTDRLRFDFTHFEALTDEQVAKVESLVNSNIQADIPVTIEEMDLESAKAKGAMALFGEKYDADKVRVVSISDYSIELCGGTHVTHTGMIESFKIIQETAVGAGTRRIEALAGQRVVNTYNKAQAKVLKDRLNKRLVLLRKLEVEAGVTTSSELIDEAEINERIKQYEKTLQARQKEVAKAEKPEIVYMESTAVVLKALPVNTQVLRNLSDDFVSATPDILVILMGSDKDKGVVLVRCGGALKNKINARDILTLVTGITGGKGGGRPDMVQAGGADPSKFAEAEKILPAKLSDFLSTL